MEFKQILNNKETLQNNPEQQDNILKNENVEEKLLSEQINILHRNFFPSILASLMLAAIIFISLLHSTSAYQINAKIWFFTVIIVTILRVCLIPLFYYLPKYRKVHLYLFLFGTSAAALLWGVAGSFLMPENDPTTQMIIILILAGVSAGGIQTLNAHLAGSILFLVLSILPLCVWLVSHHYSQYYMLSVSMILYLFFMIVSSIRNNRLFIKSKYLEYQNHDLLNDLNTKNTRLTYTINSLKNHDDEIMLLNKMNEMIQLCENPVESYSIILNTAKKLFRSINGGLTISDNNEIEVLVLHWGDIQVLSNSFPSTNCWSFRSGDPYLIKDVHNSLICKHYNTLPEGNYYCIPLIVNDKFIGMVNFNIPSNIKVTNHLMQLMSSFSNAIKLSLERNMKYRKLQDESIQDSKTGLFNRKYLNETLTRELSRMVREKNTLCVAILGLDDFKLYNDNHGHDAGDEVVTFISKYLKTTFRGSDIACKYSGDEFVLVLLNSQINNVIPRLEKIREMLEYANIFHNSISLPPITLSIGLVESPTHGISMEKIIHKASEALYEAKRSGKNRIIVGQAE